MSRRVVVALGSNLEPRKEMLERALAALGDFPSTRLVDASDVEETEPVDVPREFVNLKFLNQVARFDTELTMDDFSARMHAVEDALGRVRTIRNGPRTIDVDLVDFDGLESDSPSLTLPHPRANERAFVREPWKALVRAEMKKLRAAVSSETRARKSRELCEKLVEMLDGARSVCAYEALKSELDLAFFVDECRLRGVAVAFPEKTADGYLVRNPESVDLWVVPGLAFTKAGERLGFGGGWYDRFLASARADAVTVGVGYDFQLVSALPQSETDVKVKRVLTV